MRSRWTELNWQSFVTTAFFVTLLAASASGEESWTNYRGPTDQGLSGARNLPLQWSEGENVVWKTAIDGKAWSSPVIWGDQIWLTDAPPDGTRLMTICVDKESGKITRKTRLRTVVAPQYCHPFNSYASPSPVIDGDRLFVSFGAPFTGCLDRSSGKVLWERTDLKCNHFRGAGSSPFIYQNLLISHFDGSDFQYVIALDKQTGQTVWKTDRSVDFQDIDPSTGQPLREGDRRKAFSTPVVAQANGRPVLISAGSMALYGYDPQSGEELWRVESIGSHSAACRPVVGHGLVFAQMGTEGQLWAVRPDGRGVVTNTHVLWKYSRAVPTRASVLLVDQLLFMVDNTGVAACVEAESGTEVWRKRIGGEFSASPLYANGKIYFFDQSGKSTVIEASRQFNILAENHLDEGFMASPAVSGDALYLRSRTHLYRIEGATASES